MAGAASRAIAKSRKPDSCQCMPNPRSTRTALSGLRIRADNQRGSLLTRQSTSFQTRRRRNGASLNILLRQHLVIWSEDKTTVWAERYVYYWVPVPPILWAILVDQTDIADGHI